jgi:hypothetical protein
MIMRGAFLCVVAASAVLSAGGAEAQQRSAVRFGGTTVIGPPGTQVVRSSQATSQAMTGAQVADSASLASFGLSAGSSLGSLTGFSTPDPGFSYAHQAALNVNLAQKALVDPVTQHRLALERQIRRETPIVPLFPFFPTTQVIIVQQPPVVIINEPAGRDDEGGLTLAAGPAAPRRRMPEPEIVEIPREVAAPAEPAAPLPDLDEVVLVRRDGKLVFVVGYSTQGERLVYVTRDGFRRSMLLNELDAQATRAFNEERGVKFSG